MTQLTTHETEETAPRRPHGFAWELVYLLIVAAFFNGAVLGAAALVSGQAAPVQVLVAVSVFILFVALFFRVVRGLRFFAGPEAGAPPRAQLGSAATPRTGHRHAGPRRGTPRGWGMRSG